MSHIVPPYAFNPNTKTAAELNRIFTPGDVSQGSSSLHLLTPTPVLGRATRNYVKPSIVTYRPYATFMAPEQCHVYVVSHTDELLKNETPDSASYTGVNLAKLKIGEYQTNNFSESRLWLSTDADEAAEKSEYVAFLTGRFNHKFIESTDTVFTKLQSVHFFMRYAMEPDMVVSPICATKFWATDTASYFPDSLGLLQEACNVMGWSLFTGGPSLYCQNFICHREVYIDFLASFRKIFYHMTEKYGHDFPTATFGFDQNRKSGYFLERVTLAYFANRRDLKIMHLP